jgi:RNA polymerase sigma-70 factor (ECF subfamily)
MNREDASKIVDGLFESWYSSLLRYAARSTGSLSLAEDLVQEALMKLYRELRRGKTVENPKAWTFSVLRRGIGKQIRDHIRQGGSPESLEVVDTRPVALATGDLLPGERIVEMDEISRLFSVLSQREEEVLLLRMEALKYREIASELGIRVNSVGTLLTRALRKLQRSVKGKTDKGIESDHVEKQTPETLQ